MSDVESKADARFWRRIAAAEGTRADLVKALNAAGITLPAGATTATYSADQIAAALQSMQVAPGTPLPRTGTDTVPFGPGVPPTPYPIDPRLRSGRPAPRRSEFPVGFNLPGAGGDLLPPFKTLRQAADRCDVARRCIETTKSQITSLDWDIVLAPAAVERMMADSNEMSPGKVWRTARTKYADAIADARSFLEVPDRINGLAFDQWISALIEELLVVDAIAIYPHLTIGGALHSLEILAGDTIKPLLDHRGARPQPPAPAFEQWLYGFARGEFTASTGADATFSTDRLTYKVRNSRTWTPYGYSSTEQALSAIDLYLKRVEWLRVENTDGATPELILTADQRMTPEEILQYEQVMNDLLAGQAAERKRIRVIPAGFTTNQPESYDARFSSEIDDLCIKRICMNYSIQPAMIGFQPKTGLGGKGFSEGQESATYRQNIRPTVTYLASLVNDVLHTYLGLPDVLAFAFIGYEVEDQKQMEETYDNAVRGGRSTVNEVRAAKGQPLFDDPAADTPFVVVGSGLTPLAGALTPATTPIGVPAPVAPTAAPAATTAPTGATSPPPAPTPPAPAPDAGKAVAAELATFSKFAKARVGKAWRPFTFDHVSPFNAARLNAAGAAGDPDALRDLVVDVGKARARQGRAPQVARLADRYGPRIAAAVRNAFPSATTIAAAWVAHPHTKATTPGPAAATLRAMVDDDTDELAAIYADLYGDAYDSAATDTAAALGAAASGEQGPRWGDLVADAAAAALIATMIDRAGRRMEAASAPVGADVATVDPFNTPAPTTVDDVAAALDQLLNDPTWGDVAATTAAATAYTAGTLDEAAAQDATTKRFVFDGSSCGLCSAAGDEVVAIDDEFQWGDPPLHDACLCDIELIADTATPDTTDDADTPKAAIPDKAAIADAVAAAKALPNKGDANHVDTPWKRRRMPDALADVDWKDADVKKVSIADLYATSRRLKRDDLIWHIEHPGQARFRTPFSTHPLVARDTNGDLLIVDGHHRLAALLMLDVDKTAVWLLGLDGET